MVIGLIFAILLTLGLIYCGFGMMVVMVYETWSKDEKLYFFVITKWFWWM